MQFPPLVVFGFAGVLVATTVCNAQPANDRKCRFEFDTPNSIQISQLVASTIDNKSFSNAKAYAIQSDKLVITGSKHEVETIWNLVSQVDESLSANKNVLKVDLENASARDSKPAIEEVLSGFGLNQEEFSIVDEPISNTLLVFMKSQLSTDQELSFSNSIAKLDRR